MKMKMKMKIVLSWPIVLIVITSLLLPLLFASVSSQDLTNGNSQPEKKKKKMRSVEGETDGEISQPRRSRRSNWGYTDDRGDIGPGRWKDVYPVCGGESQSPVDILTERSVLDAQLFSSVGFGFVGYDEVSPTSTYLLTNNGHSVKLTINGSSMFYAPIGLPGSYRLEQVHFHWGKTDEMGAEHLVDGYHHPLEIHFVHYSVRYGSFYEALLHPQGLAVVAVFAETVNVANFHYGLQNIVSYVDHIRFKDSKPVEIQPFRLSALLRGIGVEYFRYNGSLTTPGCQENVVWTVFRRPISVTRTQVDKFRQLRSSRSGEPEVAIEDNFRPIQKLGTRTVIRNFVSPAERNNDVTYIVLLNLVIADAFVLILILVVLIVSDSCLKKRRKEKKEEEEEMLPRRPVKPTSPASPAPPEPPAPPAPGVVSSPVSVQPSMANVKQPSKVVITTQKLPRNLSNMSAVSGAGPR